MIWYCLVAQKDRKSGYAGWRGWGGGVGRHTTIHNSAGISLSGSRVCRLESKLEGSIQGHSLASLTATQLVKLQCHLLQVCLTWPLTLVLPLATFACTIPFVLGSFTNPTSRHR